MVAACAGIDIRRRKVEYYIARYKTIEKMTYNLEVVTPLFLGGADPTKAELRAASFKGMLRFWWRALYGASDFKELKKREAALFGSPERKSQITLTIDLPTEYEKVKVKGGFPNGKKIEIRSSKSPNPFSINILDYLAYGCYEWKDKKIYYIKEHIKPGTVFQFTLYCSKDQKEIIATTFEAFLTYGGIGARSRNGFGCLRSTDENGENLRIQKVPLQSAEYTKFTSDSRLFLSKNTTGYDTWEEALSEIGEVYREVRAEGVLEKKHCYDKRALIAKPIEVKGERIPDSIRKGRHSKPYFLHVNKLPTGKYRGQILFMPYLYDDGEERENYFAVHKRICTYFSEKLKEVKL